MSTLVPLATWRISEVVGRTGFSAISVPDDVCTSTNETSLIFDPVSTA
jgi:hypothetical protein